MVREVSTCPPVGGAGEGELQGGLLARGGGGDLGGECIRVCVGRNVLSGTCNIEALD